MDKKIVIVGLGLIGGSLAKALQEYTNCTVAGIDTNTEVLDMALKCSAINKIGTDDDVHLGGVRG